MLYKELPISFPWYDKIEQQNRYNENVQPICDYKLISPIDALLPFQFYRLTSGEVIVNWEVYEVNSNILIANISPNIPLVQRRILEGKEYFTYIGEQLIGLDLRPGYYYSRFVFQGGGFQFSEMFFIPENGFSIVNDGNIPYLKLVWYNNNDLRPIFYNDKDAQGVPKFKNVAYVDSFIHASEPELIEEGTRDGEDELVPTFQKALIPYRITVTVPDFLKKSLMLFKLHDVVKLTTQYNVRSGTLEKVTVSSALEASGALSVVDIIFQEILIIKKGCGENMV